MYHRHPVRAVHRRRECCRNRHRLPEQTGSVSSQSFHVATSPSSCWPEDRADRFTPGRPTATAAGSTIATGSYSPSPNRDGGASLEPLSPVVSITLLVRDVTTNRRD